MENARRAAFSFFPMRSGGCAPEAFVVAKQHQLRSPLHLRHSEKLRCFYLDAARTRLEKTSASHPRLRRFHYERAYRASTFEITNLSAQKTRYVSGPLKRLSCPSASFLLFLAPVSSSAHYLLQFFHGAIFFTQ